MNGQLWSNRESDRCLWVSLILNHRSVLNHNAFNMPRTLLTPHILCNTWHEGGAGMIDGQTKLSQFNFDKITTKRGGVISEHTLVFVRLQHLLWGNVFWLYGEWDSRTRTRAHVCACVWVRETQKETGIDYWCTHSTVPWSARIQWLWPPSTTIHVVANSHHTRESPSWSCAWIRGECRNERLFDRDL